MDTFQRGLGAAHSWFHLSSGEGGPTQALPSRSDSTPSPGALELCDCRWRCEVTHLLEIHPVEGTEGAFFFLASGTFCVQRGTFEFEPEAGRRADDAADVCSSVNTPQCVAVVLTQMGSTVSRPQFPRFSVIHSSLSPDFSSIVSFLSICVTFTF